MPKLERAVYDTVHDIGPERIATLIGRTVGTVYNKANPESETHVFSLIEGRSICLTTQDYRILGAFAQDLNHAAIPLGDYRQTSDLELLNLYTNVDEQSGHLATEIREALDDGKITQDELLKIRSRVHDQVRAIFTLLGRLEGMAQ